MLSTESRMRGDMQVRFGGRYGKTYCRKAVRRPVPSLRIQNKKRRGQDGTEPPVTYSHPKSGIVMIHMTGGRTYGSIRMVLPMQE